jgi:transmembrane sensor
MMASESNQPDTILLTEAADWLVRMQSGSWTAAEQLLLEQWQARSASHAAAWARAQSVLHAFGRLPARAGHDVLDTLGRQDRRRALRRLGLTMLAAPVVWAGWRQLPWDSWSADFSTATGERKTVTLPDGSQLALNTGSAVKVAFSAGERRLHLVAGEILVTTAREHAPVYRPFIVQTPQASIRALGTRFSVRLDDDDTLVAVFEHAVEVRPHGGIDAVRLDAGQQARFGADGLRQSVGKAAPTLVSWQQGMLAVQDMPVGRFVAELARYRRGWLRCDPGIAGLRISGVFPLDDIDASLAMMARTLPVRVRQRTRYWLTVEPA